MSLTLLEELEIGDKITGDPSWGVTWNAPLTVVLVDRTVADNVRVTIRRQESVEATTYQLVSGKHRADAYKLTDDGKSAHMGTVTNIERAGTASRIKTIQLKAKAGEFDRDRPDGDDAWANFYERTPARSDD